MTLRTQLDLWAALPSEARPFLSRLVEVATEAGASVHLVGGAVRDLLLEREVSDLDLVLEGEQSPEELARRSLGEEASLKVHERFGTVRFRVGSVAVDLAMARREEYARPGGLPQVAPASLAEDLTRRDFTVNSMAIALSGDPAERIEIQDPADGQSDLRARRLRVLHPRSFHDDPTRALRAARLVPRLRFTLSRSARSTLRDAVRDGAFGAVSGDRWRREFEQLFAGGAPVESLRKLAEWHVLNTLEPGLDLPREASAPLRRLARDTAALPWPGPRWRPWVAGLALWLAPMSPALRRRTLSRLSVRGEVARRIASFPRDREAWLAALGRGRGRGAVDALLSGIDEERLVALHACADPALRRRIVRWAAEDRSRRSPVAGGDLEAAGLSGPSVARGLARIRAAYLDGELANREEALALAREIARRRSRRDASKDAG